MDYEKKYREALERARCLYSQHSIEWCDKDIVTIFPELCESEDEKVRKAILELVRQSSEILDKQNQNNMIAWLEKQGEQKLPIEKKPSEMKTIGESLGFRTQKECDEYNKMVSDLIVSDDKGEQKSVGEEIVEALRTEYEKGRADAIAEMQKPWSEEDEQIKERLIRLCTQFMIPDGVVITCEDWLKSLKDRYTWKPSDEQVAALADALSLAKSCGEERAFDLRTLYEQLKKLKE